MNIQIIIRKKCQDSRKAERFFKERGIRYFTLNLSEKALSPGELRNILRVLKPEELMNEQSRLYRQKLVYMDFDYEEEFLAHPDLIRTPLVRCEGKVSAGYAPELWKTWLEA